MEARCAPFREDSAGGPGAPAFLTSLSTLLLSGVKLPSVLFYSFGSLAPDSGDVHRETCVNSPARGLGTSSRGPGAPAELHVSSPPF